ncbi:AMP-binding protein [Streptomyces sp. NPDC050145]|uniref:AMP-binding protein n=1 Tax=Streptomyces sp. NPDC050145 TaxID=3365602 RepID=UPI00378F59FA
MSNLVVALVEAAERHPQRVAVRGDESALTYAELDEFSARAAGGMRAHGVRPGDRVGLRLPYAPVYAVLYFGALRAGAIVVPMYPSVLTASAPTRADTCGARLVFTSPDKAAAARTSDTTLVQVGPDFLDQVAFWPQHFNVVGRADHDPAVLLGAGGAPDDAVDMALSHSTLRHASRTTRTLIDETAADEAHGYARASCGLHAVMLSGACLPAAPRPSTGRCRTGREGPTLVGAAPGRR